MKKITVGIIEDEKQIRDELKGQVEKMENCNLDFSIGSLSEFIKLDESKEYSTQVILLDLHLGDHTGFDVIDFLKKKNLTPKIIIISGYCDELNLLHSKKKGANAHIKKSLTAGANHGFLENIILQVFNDKLGSFLSFISEPTITITPKVKLSQQQREFLCLLLQDKTYSQIASLCNVSESTVYNVFAVLRSSKKFNVQSNTQLIKKALEQKVCL